MFHQALKAAGIRSQPIPHCAPNLNAYAERMQQTLQVECLDRFLVIGTKHLDYLVSEYIDHYNTERPHSGIGFSVPERSDTPPKLRLAQDQPASVGRVRCRDRLGGVIKHFNRMAAYCNSNGKHSDVGATEYLTRTGSGDCTEDPG